MSNISLDELRKTILKQSFLLDKMMSVCINAGVAVNCFSEHECRMLLKDIYYAWCEVREEYTPISEINESSLVSEMFEKIIPEQELEIDVVVRIPPIRERFVRVKVKTVEKAMPNIVEPGAF